MYRVTRFYVRRHSTGATVTDPEMFRDEGAALARAAFIGRRTPATVYSVTGEPLSDLWEKPVLIARFDGYAVDLEPTSNVVRISDWQRPASRLSRCAG